jgi:hypothetical protein
MPVVGLTFTSIEAKVEKANVTGDIKIDSQPKILNMEKKDVGIAKDALVVEFSFITKYDPNVGSISMKGEVVYQSDSQKKVLDRWKKDKKIEGQFAIEVLNAIFRKSIVKAIAVSDDLRLPSPIQLPTVRPEVKKD